MFRRGLLILFLTTLWLLSSTAAMALDGFDFFDTPKHWAAENIAQCSAYQLMNGYPGRVFMPEQSLSRAEALLVIGKSLGLDKGMRPVSTDTISFPKDIWPGFKEYIVLAADGNLINKADIANIHFNEPASRLEMAVWIAKAMNLSGNAAALSFQDLAWIPQRDRVLLAGVVEESILVGLPGNVFAPEKSLTRAEMATILVRMADKGKITPAAGKMISGKVKAIDWLQRKVSIEQSYGATKTFPLSQSYSAYRQGVKTLPDDLAVGDSVKLIVDAQENCLLILNQSPKKLLSPLPQGSGNKGYVINKYWDYFSVRLQYGTVQEVSSTVMITDKGTVGSYGALAKGSYVELFQYGDAVSSVNIIDDTRKVFGTVQSVNDYQITIRDDDQKSGSFDVLNNPRITDRDGDRVYLDEINTGDYLEITLDVYGKVKEVKVGMDSANDLEGRVSSIRTAGSKRIVIEDNDGESHAYDISDRVQVKQNGSSGKLSDINADMWVQLELDGSDEVDRIEIVGDELAEGKVTGIWLTGDQKIRIEKSNGDEKTYYLDDIFRVTKGGSVRSLDDLEKEDSVRLYLNRGSLISRIEILDQSSVEGRVDYITTSGSDKIRIKQNNGELKTYYLASDVRVKEGSSTRSLSYLEKDMDIKLILNSAKDVIRIDILDDSDVSDADLEGKLLYIQTAGNDRMLEIVTTNGGYGKYYFAKNLTVSENGEARNLNYLVKGMDVQLTLNGSGDVSRIDIDGITGTTYVTGEVTAITRTGSRWRVDIVDDHNRRYSYYFGSDVDVRENGDDLDILDITKTMFVQLTLVDDDQITRIDVFGSNKIEGVVTYFRSSSNRITIRESDGSEEVYYLGNSVSVSENGNSRRLSDVDVGMKIRLTLNGEDDVTRIEIVGASFVEGKVTYLRTTGTKRIEIKNENNNHIEMYDLGSSVQVWQDHSLEVLEDIGVGDRVILTLDDNGKVVRIDL